MSSLPLILNEWVIHDLCGENKQERQIETFQFLERIQRKCDYIVLLRGSPWMNKAYQFMQASDVQLRYYSMFLHGSFISNSAKCKIYNTDEIISIPRELKEFVPEADSYLIELHLTEPGSIIITTDIKLVEALHHIPNIAIKLRDEFIKEYS